MQRDLQVMLTNDDGIDAPGLQAMYDALSDIASVTVVAPVGNQSGAGRSLTYGRVDGTDEPVEEIDLKAKKFSCTVPHRKHELGYAINGTPCDCVVVGVNALDPAPDVVVSGCNPGINLGMHVFTRSGTVSAAYESACLGIPALAVSVDKLGFEAQFEPGHFEPTAEITSQLLDHAIREDIFDKVDYVNVNAPRPDQAVGSIELTEPTNEYELDAEFEDKRFRLTNRNWERFTAEELVDPPGTDRRAVQDGNISISALEVPFEPRFPQSLATFADIFNSE